MRWPLWPVNPTRKERPLAAGTRSISSVSAKAHNSAPTLQLRRVKLTSNTFVPSGADLSDYFVGISGIG